MADIDKRLKLDNVLRDVMKQVLGDSGVHIYYQPGPSIHMSYPAIVYSRNGINEKNANNEHYKRDLSYKVTVIDDDPDSELVEAVSHLPLCTFDTHYTSNNLNHDVFTIYI